MLSLYKARAVFDITVARVCPSNTRVLISVKIIRDQDFVFLYLPLTLGLPLGFPSAEEVTIHTHTHTQTSISQETTTAERTLLVSKECTNECCYPETSKKYHCFSKQTFAFLCKAEVVAHCSLRTEFVENFYGLAGHQNGMGRGGRCHRKY